MSSAAEATKKRTLFRPLPKAKSLPATQGMLALVRDELKADGRTIRAEMRAGFKKIDARFDKMEARFSSIDARFSSIDARFNEMEARFSSIDARFNEIDARFNQMDARFGKLDAQLLEMKVMMEAQDTRNLAAYEAFMGMVHRQSRLEDRQDQVETWMRSLKPARANDSN